jgi:periplasmic divalent cation tolerance protein
VADPLPQPIMVFITFPSLEEAQRISAALVDEHLAACVNLLPGVRSMFFWEGVREEASEIVGLAKTTQQRFDDLAARVKSLHSYSVPEIIALPILWGNGPYLKWLQEMVSSRLNTS